MSQLNCSKGGARWWWAILLVGHLSHCQLMAQIGPPGRPDFSFPLPTDPCNEYRNITDSEVSRLPRHRYLVLEQCIYYHVSRQVEQNSEIANSLYLVPPLQAGQNISIHIEDVTIQSFWLNDMTRDAHMRGHIKVFWGDFRINWDKEKWRLSEMKLQAPGHIWIPDLVTSRFDSALSSTDFLDFRHLKASSSGTVSGFVNFNLQTNCVADLEAFPYDKHRCRYAINPNVYADITDFVLEEPFGGVDYELYTENGWHIESVKLSSEYDSEGTAMFYMDLQLGRASTTLRVEMIMPIGVCALLVLIAPLFGHFKSQMHLKLFTVLILFMCLNYLSNRMSYLGLAKRTPKIYQFYELTMVTTMFSLLVTLIFSMAERQERILPPHQGLAKFCRIMDQFLFCCVQSSASGKETGDHKNYSQDWKLVFIAMHNLCSFLVIVFYAIGLAIIYA